MDVMIMKQCKSSTIKIYYVSEKYPRLSDKKNVMIMKQCKSSTIKIYYVSEKYPRLSDKKNTL